jgi:ribonucleoside-diphosphate reductase alpha chain
MDTQEREDLGIRTVSERLQPTLPGVEEATTVNHPGMDLLPPEDRAPSHGMDPLPMDAAPTPKAAPPEPQLRPQVREAEVVLCYVCGDIMQRAGSCHACPSCGATSGCS